MTSYLSESFFVSSRGNMAIYLCLFQMPKMPKKMIKVENKGGTQLSIFCKPLWSYLVDLIRTGKYWSHILLSKFLIADPIRTDNTFNSVFYTIWPWTTKFAWEITVAGRFLLATTEYQTTSIRYSYSVKNLLYSVFNSVFDAYSISEDFQHSVKFY